MDKVVLPHQHPGMAPLEKIAAELKNTQNFQLAAEVFKQLSDPTRIRIFWLLCHTEQCVINISALLEMSSPAVSHHLRGLRSCGLIHSRRDGKEVYYHASQTPQAQLLHEMIEQVMSVVCPA